jgi:hypothetical protein
MKRSPSTWTAFSTLAILTITVFAFADPPVNRYTPKAQPAALAIAGPGLTSVTSVPVDGDVSSARVRMSVVVPPGWSRPPRAGAAVERVVLPINVGAATGFSCNSEGTQCSFPMMPHYSQTNPNLAFINVPPAVYQAELPIAPYPYVRVTGGIPATTWDAASAPQAWALTFVPNYVGPGISGVLDPFYASWLPLGPLPGDQGNISGLWYTALCPATASAMMLMAALSAKSAETQVKPGSWVETSFIKATKPADCRSAEGPVECQSPIALPLKTDHNTLAPNNAQMTVEELQRLINTAIKWKTDPGNGGTAHWDFIKNDFTSTDSRHPNPYSTACPETCGPPYTTEVIVDLIRKRTAVGLWFADYTVKITSTKDASGKVTKKTATFKNTGGHTVAVNGFTGGGTPNASLILYDPVYANTLKKPIVLAAPPPYTHDGVPLEVTFPMGAQLATMAYSGDPAISNVSQLRDGQLLTVIAGYHTLHLD